MIATLATVKNLLGYTDDTKDAMITELMPIVQNHITTYCNNNFVNRTFSYKGALTFVNDGIVYDVIQGDFVDLPFQNDIHVSTSELDMPQLNFGFYTVTSKTDTEITLDTIGAIYNEETTARIMNVDYPVGLILPFSLMIGYSISENAGTMGISSESKLDYSVGYADLSGYMYPARIVEMLKMYRSV